MRHKLSLGVATHGPYKGFVGEVEWTLENGKFSMSGALWTRKRMICEVAGQCIDTLTEAFPHHELLQRMRPVWKRWHLNDFRAGSPVQEDYLRADPVTAACTETHYDKASEALRNAGLNPDAEGYRYGTALKTETIPADVVAEIESWSAEALG